MKQLNGMQNDVRYLRGRVDVNFYSDDSTDSSSVTCQNSSLPHLENYLKQITQSGLAFSNKAAVLSGNVVNAENCKLNRGYILCGDGGETDELTLGWYGVEQCDANGAFKNDQILTLRFSNVRELDNLVICGDNLRGEYPQEFEIYCYADDNASAVKVEFTTRKRKTPVEVEGEADYLRNEIVASFNYVTAKKIELRIKKWSAPATVAKINYLASERVESYLGDKLKSITIVEEKTGDTDKLSYGISSNSCSFEFLNENKRFYYNKGYSMLIKNRRIYPYIRCGDGEFSKPLGVFYSDEWKIEDGNPYVSCKAYDVLYPLQDLTINYGVQVSEVGGEKYTMTPYMLQTINQIFTKVFELINMQRRANGIYNKLNYSLRIGEIGEKIIPFVLIKEKSAWDVLQDLANLTCSYIYCDRQGTIIIKRDDFSGSVKSHEEAKNLSSINPSNSFSYSLPILSQTVVNSVNTEYYGILKDSDVGSKEVSVKEFTKKDGKLIATVKLDKIYAVLRIGFVTNVKSYNILSCSYDKIELQVDLQSNITEITVGLNFNSSFSLVKNSFTSQSNTIEKFGLREFNYKAENLIFDVNDYFCKLWLNALNEYLASVGQKPVELFDYRQISKKILEKYELGVTYVDAEWTGDYDLSLGTQFCGKSQYDEDGIEEIYECISSEIKYGSGFRQKIKGRECCEISHDNCNTDCNGFITR